MLRYSGLLPVAAIGLSYWIYNTKSHVWRGAQRFRHPLGVCHQNL